MKQEYALKEYVSENNYGKIINGSSSEILTNCNLTGDEAEAKIVALFGSIDLFKSCVQDMLDNHTRYFYHTEGGTDSCKEINGLAWKDCSGNVTQGGDGVIEIGRYIDFHKDFDSNSSDYTCRLQDDSDTPRQVILPSEEGTIALTKDINWDNIQSTIRFSNEFNFCDDSQGDYCWINYRGKSGNTTSADKLFIGNGQSNGGYGALVTTHYDHPSNQQMYLGSKSNNSWIRCQDICCLDGEVGDGIWSIRTNGNAQFQRVASVNGFFKESDKRLKSNIQPLNHTIEQICAIPTDKFVMNGHIQIGTIAQDLENIVPEIVSEDYKLASEVSNKEEFEIIERKDKERVEEYIKVKKVEYEMLGVLAIEGIKLLKQEIDKLNNRIKELENGRDSDVEHD